MYVQASPIVFLIKLAKKNQTLTLSLILKQMHPNQVSPVIQDLFQVPAGCAETIIDSSFVTNNLGLWLG